MSENSLSAGLRLFRNPNVGRMFIAYLISYTGTAMAPIAMAFGVLELTGSTKDSAIVIAAPTFAAVAVLLFGGVVADRTSRKKVIYSADMLAMCAQFVLAYLLLSGNASIFWLTFFMLLNGVALAFHAPAATGLIVQLVDKEDLQSTNAILGMARNGAMAGGAALGGILVALFGAGMTLAIDAASFAVSALLVFSLKPKEQAQPEAASVIQDLKLGWKEFTAHTWLWVIVLQFAFVVAGIESVFGLIGPAVARQELGGAVAWGIIASAFGVGMFFGGITAIKIRPKHPMRVGTFCVFFLAALPLALMWSLPIYVMAIAAFAGGITIQIFAVIWYTLLQTKIPPHMLSRVSAYDHLGSIALAPLGIVAAGILYETFGYQTTLLLAAAIIIVPTACALMVRDVWMMTSD